MRNGKDAKMTQRIRQTETSRSLLMEMGATTYPLAVEVVSVGGAKNSREMASVGLAHVLRQTDIFVSPYVCKLVCLYKVRLLSPVKSTSAVRK